MSTKAKAKLPIKKACSDAKHRPMPTQVFAIRRISNECSDETNASLTITENNPKSFRGIGGSEQTRINNQEEETTNTTGIRCNNPDRIMKRRFERRNSITRYSASVQDNQGYIRSVQQPQSRQGYCSGRTLLSKDGHSLYEVISTSQSDQPLPTVPRITYNSTNMNSSTCNNPTILEVEQVKS